LHVRGTRAIGVRRRHGELEVHRRAAPLGDDVGGCGGNLDQRRKRRSRLAAGCEGKRQQEGGPNIVYRAAAAGLKGPRHITSHRMYRDRSSFFTISASIFETYASSIVTCFAARSGPSNEISSRSFSITVCRR